MRVDAQNAAIVLLVRHYVFPEIKAVQYVVPRLQSLRMVKELLKVTRHLLLKNFLSIGPQMFRLPVIRRKTLPGKIDSTDLPP
ncbi:hypothetical protein ACFLWS_08725 [Chloroflexota bacterium]